MPLIKLNNISINDIIRCFNNLIKNIKINSGQNDRSILTYWINMTYNFKVF